MNHWCFHSSENSFKLQLYRPRNFISSKGGCSYEKNQPGKTGCLGLPRSRLCYQFLIKIFELSYEKRAGPAKRAVFSHMTAPALTF